MEKILVLDFGGQYNQLIARRVRDNNVYAEILPYTTPIEVIKANNYKGIIFTGGPNSVYDMKSPHYTKEILELGIPVLGICYGCQLIAWMCDGVVKTAPVSEYGKGQSAFQGHSRKKRSLDEPHRLYSTAPRAFRGCRLFKGLSLCGNAISRKGNLRRTVSSRGYSQRVRT